MPSVDTLYQTKFRKQRKTDNLMAGRNHNQLQSSWDLYLSNEGRWAIYMLKIRHSKVGEGERKEREQFHKQRKKARLDKRHFKISLSKISILKACLKDKQNSFSEETLKWARRKHSFAPTRTNPLTTGMLLLKRS